MKKMADMMSRASKWLLVFGVVISQLSFPLQVIAEELDSDDMTIVEDAESGKDTDNGTVVVDFTEVTGNEYTYTIKALDNTNVTFILKYQDLEEVVSFDFSERLYGEYHYSFNDAEKTLIINYVGDNAELLNNYKNTTDLMKDLSCSQDECIISGFGTDLVTVADITSKYYDIEAFKTERNALVSVTDGERTLADDEVVLNGYKLVISQGLEENLLCASPASIYTINRVGDVYVPADGLIDTKDQTAVLDDIILERELTSANDVNADGVLNILDATDSTFMNIYNGQEVSDILTNTLVLTSEEVLIGETIQVQLYVNGLTSANIYGIEGLVQYDDSILELVGVSLYTNEEVETVQDNLGSLNLENGRFAYVLANGFNSADEAILTLEFEAIAVGTSEISVSNILESYGLAFELENNNVYATLVVEDPEDNKGGDEEDKIPDDDTTGETTEDITTGTTTEVEKDTPVAVVTPVVKSSDYYISDLIINGYEINFDMYTYEYNITVDSGVTSLNLDVLLHDSNSIYYVEGNENFVSGENLVRVVVKAENGSTKTYTIKVEKEKKTEEVVKNNSEELDEEEDEKTSSVSKTIIIILIILVIIGLIYVIFKDDEEEKETKKEEKTKSEKVKESRVEKTEPKKSESKTKETKTTKSTNNGAKKNTKKVNK